MSNATLGKLSNKLTRHLQATWKGSRFVCRFSANTTAPPAMACLKTGPCEEAVKAEVTKFLTTHGISEAQIARIHFIRLDSWGNI